ncbi:MAG: hypothetical protein LBD94_00725, partial [Rickettsiales bacterium]|nr:hypothetical protein [Rickettsiales bacterium]
MKKILTLFVALFLTAASVSATDYGRGHDGNPYAAGTVRAGVAGTVGVPAVRAPTLPVPINPTPTPVTPDPVVPVQPATPAYSVENCMNDLSNCVESNLPNGISALYNADMRNSVINGMNLCGIVVDKCMNETVRTDGNKAYYAKNDVWIDFNSRIIQPQYYSHVLMKTGLTPNQAENTCLLLDRNVLDSSFKGIDGGSNPDNQMGSVVNNQQGRGSYARWDATTGECLVRVAAYNKDELITNKWFAVVTTAGDNKPAEQWVKAGSSFSCKKELFDFNLMNQTMSVAATAGVWGTVAGAGVGAWIGGANSHAKSSALIANLCEEKDYRQLLEQTINELNLEVSGSSPSSENGCRGVVDILNQDRVPTKGASTQSVVITFGKFASGASVLEVGGTAITATAD